MQSGASCDSCNSFADVMELASVIRRVYLKALDTYRIEQEDKAAVGHVDFILCPFLKNDDGVAYSKTDKKKRHKCR